MRAEPRAGYEEQQIDVGKRMDDAVGVPEISEQTLIADVQARLTKQYSEISAEEISTRVQRAHAHFDQSPIRDFVPLLVERRVRHELTTGIQTALVDA